MPSRKEIEPGIEVSGMFVESYLEAFKLFPSVAMKRLVSFGFGTMQGKDFVFDRQGWYPLENWLAVHDEISATVGPRVTYQIGQQIPKIPPLPPTITDIHSMLAGVNVMYHMYHRKGGKPLFDPTTGKMTQGIGTYGYAADGKQKIVSVCDDPYPCDLDRGLLTGFAQRFERFARVAHDDRAPCRKTGGANCTYVVTW